MQQSTVSKRVLQLALVALMMLMTVAIPFSGSFAPNTNAAERVTGTNERLYINTFGGQNSVASDPATAGTDGIAIVINGTGSDTLTGGRSDAPDPGSDQIWFAGTEQWCCSGYAPVLAVGTTGVGTAGANPTTEWDSIEVLATSGTATTDLAVANAQTSTGSGYALIRYTTTVGGLIYKVDREITYTAPNRFFDDVYTVTIPATNSAAVKLYMGGDTSPGGEDEANGIGATSPVRTVISLEQTAGILIGFREVEGQGAFSLARSANYYDPYAAVKTGGDIVDEVDLTNHDAGLMVQWNMGSTPGTFERTMQQFVNFQSVMLEAAFAGNLANRTSTLNLQLTNTFPDAMTGVGYTFTLPAGMTVSGAYTNNCGGTVTATVGSSTVTVTGVPLAGLAICTLLVPVGRATPGVSTITSASVTSPLVVDGVYKTVNGVGTQSINFTFGSATATRTSVPTKSNTPTITLTPSNTRTPSNTAVPTNTFTKTATKTPTASNTSTPTNTKPPTATMTPTPIPFMMKKGAVGANFVLALLQNGTLVTWGMNREYQANISPCCGSDVDDIAVGTNFAVVVKKGRVYGWGANTRGQLNFPLMAQKDVVSIAAGYAHVLAVKTNGSVLGWGENTYKQATVPKSVKNVASVAGGSYHSLAVTKLGKVLGWGRNTSGQAKVPAKLTNVSMVAGGLDHSLALKKDGTVVGWGGNDKWQSKIPTGLKDVKFISAGNKFSLALKNDGTPFAWGDNTFGQTTMPNTTIGSGYTGVFTVAAGYANSIIGLRNGGILVVGDKSAGVDVSRTATKTATPTP